MGPLEMLGQWAAALRWDDVPASAQLRACLAFRDTIGTIVGGANTTAGRIATATAAASPGQASVVGSDVRATPLLAAFATAVNASALDFDDGHYRGGAIHPASVVVSSLLVAMQTADLGPEDVLTAQVAGYEIGVRAAHLLWPRHPLDDYHCTGTAGALAAAVAVAKLRGADAGCIARAVSTAWAHAPMSTFQLPMVKESIGWSAATGLFAADLAAGGFMRLAQPSTSAMDRTFTPTPFHRDGAMEDPFVASLGTTFETANTYFKPYAACRYTHTAARSLRTLVEAAGCTADDVEAIEVHTHRAAIHLMDQRPASLDHGQYSFPFVLAAVLCTGDAGAEEISEQRLGDEARLSQAAKVTVHHDPQLDLEYPAHYGTRVVMRTTHGATLEQTRLIAPGDADDPMSLGELGTKFARLTASTDLDGLPHPAGDIVAMVASP